MAKAKILIVEDEAIIAHDTKIKLEMQGYEVVDIVDTGEKAVKCMETYKPDLVLMDIVLNGGMNGIEAAEIISSGNNIPILFLSAHSEKDLLNHIKTGVQYNYLIKPVTGEELFLAVIKSLNISNGQI